MIIKPNTNKSYTGYTDIESDDICLVMSFYNALNYKSTVKNLQLIIQELNKTNIPFYIIELLYPQQKQSIPQANYIVRADSFFFSKENLWNIIESKIPDKYTKLIFTDVDILYSDPDWIDKISILLDTYKVIHGCEYLYKDIYRKNIYDNVNLNAGDTKHTVVKSIIKQKSFEFNNVHPGYNICIERNFYHKIGRLFEYAHGTAGDTLFWASFVKDYEPYCCALFSAPRFKEVKEKYIEYKNNILKLCDPIKDVNYLKDNCGLHLFHGHPKNREYGNQDRFIPGPIKFSKNSDGVIEMKIIHPIVKDLKQYLEFRREDDDIEVDSV
jgi:hypothetical protein